jgi:hypothetical protein
LFALPRPRAGLLPNATLTVIYVVFQLFYEKTICFDIVQNPGITAVHYSVTGKIWDDRYGQTEKVDVF